VTYIPTDQGWLYLAIVMDLHARKIVGWSMADHQKSSLVEAALDMAIRHHRPAPGVIHHSDRGGQYLADSFIELCDRYGLRRSVGTAGDCYDNSVTESFFATLEVNYSTGPPSRPTTRPGLLYSTSSRDSTTAVGGTRPTATSARTTTKQISTWTIRPRRRQKPDLCTKPGQVRTASDERASWAGRAGHRAESGR
jgi:transposase InsO family protein